MQETVLRIGKYEVVRELGSGGFGKTYLVEDSGNRCVLKEFSPSLGNDSQKSIELFKDEASRLKEVGNHSQIPSFYEYFEEDDRLFIAQQFIAGQSLQELLDEGVQFSQSDVEELLRQVLPLLTFLHQNNLIHRDIKPANIIKNSTGDYVLVDFGAAKRVSETVLAKTGTTIGSVGYTAMEQLRGRTTYSSDIYSLGMTCLHLLTGTVPASISVDLETGALLWRLELASKVISEPFALVLDRMVEDYVGKRYKSAEDVLAALKTSSKEAIALRASEPSLDPQSVFSLAPSNGDMLHAPGESGSPWQDQLSSRLDEINASQDLETRNKKLAKFAAITAAALTTGVFVTSAVTYFVPVIQAHRQAVQEARVVREITKENELIELRKKDPVYERCFSISVSSRGGQEAQDRCLEIVENAEQAKRVESIVQHHRERREQYIATIVTVILGFICLCALFSPSSD